MNARRILIVGATPLAALLSRAIAARPRCRLCVAGVVDDGVPADEAPFAQPRFGPVDRLPEIIEQVRPDRIVVALAERRGRTPLPALLECCLARGIAVDDAAECYERLTGRLAVETLTPASIAFSGKFRPSLLQQSCARLLSVLVAGAGLLLLLPVLGLIALAIKLDSAGPVLFHQRRIGLRGRPFTLLKFRTMREAATSRSEWVADNGDRLTRVGRWLRALRLDELPQFINVLRGEMNLVGPRPHPVSNLELFTLVVRNLNEKTGAAVSYYTLRSIVRPGLTGWAQVRYRYANNLEEEVEKLRYDLYYVKHASVRLDLRILLATFTRLVTGRLADGIERAPAPQPAPAPVRSFRFLGRLAARRAA
ncbi:MAG TPA: exopolysaccharide biosynthesis polyprenyl glycosylphosphotransferase [Vicinamibacterales bacterium]